MNQRLQQFLAAENISQSQFADSIKVARASVSHVLAGRNNPGYDFIKSISTHYPNLNLEWLINGKGKMYKTATALAQVEETVPAAAATGMVFADSDDLFAPDSELAAVSENLFSAPLAQATAQISQPQTPEQPVKTAFRSDNQRNIAKVIIFYDDGSFRELK